MKHTFLRAIVLTIVSAVLLRRSPAFQANRRLTRLRLRIASQSLPTVRETSFSTYRNCTMSLRRKRPIAVPSAVRRSQTHAIASLRDSGWRKAKRTVAFASRANQATQPQRNCFYLKTRFGLWGIRTKRLAPACGTLAQIQSMSGRQPLLPRIVRRLAAIRTCLTQRRPSPTTRHELQPSTITQKTFPNHRRSGCWRRAAPSSKTRAI